MYLCMKIEQDEIIAHFFLASVILVKKSAINIIAFFSRKCLFQLQLVYDFLFVFDFQQFQFNVHIYPFIYVIFGVFFTINCLQKDLDELQMMLSSTRVSSPIFVFGYMTEDVIISVQVEIKVVLLVSLVLFSSFIKFQSILDITLFLGHDPLGTLSMRLLGLVFSVLKDFQRPTFFLQSFLTFYIFQL